MPMPHIGQGNLIPKADGEINLYVSGEGRDKSWFNAGTKVVFVNGMDNSGENHSKSAQLLSLTQGCSVVGVFNKSGGFVADVTQCLRDKLKLVTAQTGGFNVWQAGVDAGYAIARKAYPMLSKENFVGTIIDANKATLSLYNYLIGIGPGERKKTRIFSHSQGNLITSNALTAVALALGKGAIQGIEVNSFGSPCKYWPEGIRRNNFAFTFDPVSWLDLTMDLTSSKVGFPPGIVAHGFDFYMKQDAEFTVNRFRWGSLGMTANMDEEGLAKYCVALGSNTERLTRIFQRLKSAHWTDSDDIAEIYVRKMRTERSGQMKEMAGKDSAFIKLLIALLESGVTFAGERREINYLKTLI